MNALDQLRGALAAPASSGVNLGQLLADKRREFAQVHPLGEGPHIDRFLRLALTNIGLEPDIAACTPASIVEALRDVARYGLELGGVRAQAYLTRDDGRARFQLGYRGVIDLAGRAGIVCEVHEVHENDHFQAEWGTEQRLVHRRAMRDRGPVVAWWAIARFRSGHDPQFHVMSKPEVEQVRDEFGRDRDGVWRRHFGAMANKTVLLRLLNYLPYSDGQLIDALARDAVNAGVAPAAANTIEEFTYAGVEAHHDGDPFLHDRDAAPDGADREEARRGAPEPGPAPEGSDGGLAGDAVAGRDPVAEAAAFAADAERNSGMHPVTRGPALEDRTMVELAKSNALSRMSRGQMEALAAKHGITVTPAARTVAVIERLVAELPDDVTTW